jgi:DTW domain-containing protein YfiP
MALEGHTAARGYRLLRCSTCYLPLDVCICAWTPTIRTSAQFWLLIHPDECRKPTNTARLIGASIPHTRFFAWYRTAPPAEFIALLTDRQFMPYLLVPQGDATLFERLRARPWLPDRVPAFVLLDGTWSQARRMLHRSPYLQGIPRLAIQPKTPSTYRLRCQRCAQHLSTVEVAIALLEQLDEVTASSVLHAYFRVFAESCMAARHGHPLTKPLPEMAQLLAYNSHNPQPDSNQSPPPATASAEGASLMGALPPGRGLG